MTVTMTVNRNTIHIDTSSGYITGATYPIREWIKDNFRARWDAAAKAWVADTAVIAEELLLPYYNKYIVKPSTPATPTARHTHASNGRCPRCGTYCYGDCTA